MTASLGNHFNAFLSEDDDHERVRSEQLEHHHVADPDLMDSGEGGPTLIEGHPAIHQSDSHPPQAAGVGPQLELLRHRREVLGEVQGHRNALKLRGKDHLAEVGWTSLFMVVVVVS